MRLKTIRIRGFRGFNEEQTISLDHDAILVYGLNGSGKSSLVESLEWLFFGDISRRARSSCRSEYMSNYLRNVHYAESTNPFVEATVTLHGAERLVRKELVGVTGCCHYIDGMEAEDLSNLGVSLENHSKPILSQGEIRSFVDTEQKDRWNEISKILGLEVFGAFRVDLQNLRNKLENSEQYQDAIKQRNSIIVHLENKQWLPAVVQVAKKEPYVHVDLLEALADALVGILGKRVNLQQGKSLIEQRRNEILTKVKDPKGLQLLEYERAGIPTTESERILKTIEDIVTKFGQIVDQSADQEYVRFLDLGLNLLRGKICPFCEKETISSEKEEELRKRLKIHRTILKAINDLESLIKSFDSNALSLSRKLKAFIPSIPKFNLAVEQLQEDSLWHDEGRAVQDILLHRIPMVQQVIQEVNSILDGFRQSFAQIIRTFKTFDATDLNVKASLLKQKLRATLLTIQDMVDEIRRVRDSIVAKADELSEDERNEYERLGYVDNLMDQLRFFKIVATYEDNIHLLEQLISDADQFEKSKTGELLKSLSSKICEYYEKLNPNEHILFKEAIPSSGTARQVRLKASSYDQEINPVTCFSEAHMNSLGISLYFPQRVDYNPDWGFIILDDPIQSMDDDHSNMLIDILKEHQSSKQIIVLSHSKEFCERFKSRFGRENILCYEFVQGNERGPNISLENGPIQVLLQMTEELRNGSFEQRKTAGGHLRRAVERFLMEYLVLKGQNRVDLFGLEKRQLVRRARNNAGLPDSVWHDINTILSYADTAAHGQDITDIKPGDLAWGIKTLKDLMKRHKIVA